MDKGRYRDLVASPVFVHLIALCGGIWLFAADELIVATMLPGILGDIGGASLVGLMGASFEAAAIVAGALSAYLARRRGIRFGFSGAAVLFALGCALSASAPDMPVFLVGRVVQAVAGGGMLSLTFIAVGGLFSSGLMARAYGVVSMIWGLAAFSGPLVGGVAITYAGWRAAFIYAGLLALGLAVWSFRLFAPVESLTAPRADGPAEPFPRVRMGYLFVGVMALAGAGVVLTPMITPALIVVGIGLMVLFVRRDGVAGGQRLLPRDATRPLSRVGSAMLIAIFISGASLASGLLSPVLVAKLYGWPPIVIGYALFLGAFGWTLAASLLSGIPERREHWPILLGIGVATLASAGFLAGFHFDFQPALWASYLLGGAGVGSAWTFIVRRASQHPDRLEKDRVAAALPTMQRLGLALAAGFLGIVANGLGFSETMDVATARTVTYWVFGLSLPMALVALAAALVFVWPALSGRDVPPVSAATPSD